MPTAGLGNWLRKVQRDGAALADAQHVPLSRVQRCGGLARGELLFESLVAVENYPLETALGAAEQLAVGGVEYVGQTHYPLTIVASSGAELSVRVTGDPTRFDGSWVEGAAESLREVLMAMAREPESRVHEIGASGWTSCGGEESYDSQTRLVERFERWADEQVANLFAAVFSSGATDPGQ